MKFNGQFSVTKGENKLETYDDPKGYPQGAASDAKGALLQNSGTGNSWNVNALLHYNKEVKGHFFNLTSGVNAREAYDEGYSTSYKGFQLSGLTGPTFAASQPNKTGYTATKTRLMGALASLNYSYNNIYLLDLSTRLDGSSQFGTDERMAQFWAVGTGLNIHNYDWMKSFNKISNLKIRGSYGPTGKVNFPSYTAVTSYSINANSWYYTGAAGSIIYLGNSSLKWENTKTLDVGFELGLFNNRLNLITTYYNRRTVDLIDQVSISPASGFTTYRANSGSIVNKGVELNLNAIVYQSNDLNISVRANYGANQNRIKSLGASSIAYNKAINDNYNISKTIQTTAPLTRYYVGASTTAIYAVRSDGIDPANGKERFIKLDGSSTYTWSSEDQVVVGDITPKARGALGFNIAYRRFYINTSFLYQTGGQYYNTTLLNKVENADVRSNNVDRRVLLDRWKKPGDIAPFYNLGTFIVTNPTDRFVQNYNFLNFNSCSIGYDFNKATVEKLRLAALGIRLNANDIARWSTILAERGTSYPYAKNYELTLNVSFK